MLEMDLVVESYMAGIGVDCLVNTACNRILDDYEKFPKPLIDISDIRSMTTSS